MKGSLMISGILSATVIMGGGLWYALQIAPYEETKGQSTIFAFDEELEVSNYHAINGSTSPLKFRACFDVDWSYDPSDTYKNEATPLVGPKWFSCFDAKQITSDIASSAATVKLATSNEPFGTTTYIAHYPDGRAFMWRQLNACGDAYYSGEPLPSDCPQREGSVQQADAMIDPNDEIFEIKLTSIIDGVLDKVLLEGLPRASFTSDGKNYTACFSTSSSLPYLTETYRLVDQVEPSLPIGNLPCFNTTNIKDDIDQGQAVAFLGQENIIEGFDRIIVIYDNGDGLAWHQRAN